MKKSKKTTVERLKALKEASSGGVGDKVLATAPERMAANNHAVGKLGLGPDSSAKGANERTEKTESSDLIASISDLKISILSGDDDDTHYLFEARGRSKIIGSSVVIGNRQQAINELRRIGIFATSSSMRKNIDDLIAAAQHDPSTIVATYTGFERARSPRYFAYGDGSIISVENDLRVISSVEDNISFASAGDLRVYEKGIAKVARNQSVPITLFFFGLAQVVKPFVIGTGYKAENVMFDLVGRSTVYKSALVCTLAASAWGTVPDPTGNMENAYARGWNMSPEKIEEHFTEYNGHLLILDEATLADTDQKKRADKILNTVHRMSSGQGRARYREKIQGHSVSMLSTSNQPMREILAETDEVRRALEVRLISFELKKEKGESSFFDTVPKGFSSVEKAMAHIFEITQDNYGLLARRFIEDVLRFSVTDSQKLAAIIKKAMSKFVRSVGMHVNGVDPISYRRVQPFALTYATAVVAFKVGTLDKRLWGHVKRSIRAAWIKHGSANSPTVEGDPRIVSYMMDKSNIFIDARGGAKPNITDANFKKISGMVFEAKDGTLCLAIPNAASAKFGLSKAILKQLKRQGLLRAGKNLQSKLALRRVGTKEPRDVFYVFRVKDIPAGMKLFRDPGKS
jgi:hypothetical protein